MTEYYIRSIARGDGGVISRQYFVGDPKYPSMAHRSSNWAREEDNVTPTLINLTHPIDAILESLQQRGMTVYLLKVEDYVPYVPPVQEEVARSYPELRLVSNSGSQSFYGDSGYNDYDSEPDVLDPIVLRSAIRDIYQFIPWALVISHLDTARALEIQNLFNQITAK